MTKKWIAVAVLAVAAVPLVAQADTSKYLASIGKKTESAIAMVTFKVEGAKQGQEKTIRGIGVCVNAKGLFMTLAVSPTAQLKMLKDFRLVLPGVSGKSIKAKLLGVDPGTGISFVQATELHEWTAVAFAPAANLAVGQQVVSVGLMGGSGGRTPYLGTGYVSAVFRVPGHLAYVTGGKLTGVGSPVFSTEGQAIGIVTSQQLPLTYQMISGRRSVSVRLSGRQETAFFLPVDEFVHVLKSPPMGGKAQRLPWVGAIRFEPIGEELAGIIKLDRPGVMIDQIVPGHPADKAGLKNRDVIIAMGGQPLERMATPQLVAQNFVRLLRRMKPGGTLKLTVLRGTKQEEVTVTLGEMPTQPHEAQRYVQTRLGFIVREKVEMDRYADQGPTSKVEGLVVMLVVPRTAAAVGGLRPGDLVTNCNDQPVKTVKTFQGLVEGAIATKPNQAINLLVRRGDQSLAISVQVPKARTP